MLRLTTLALVLVLGIAGYFLTRPTPLAQPSHHPLLGSLAAQPTALPAKTLLGLPTVPRSIAAPLRQATPSTVVSQPVSPIAPSAIGAGYGQDPRLVATLVTFAVNGESPARAAMRRRTAPRLPLLHLPAVLPDRTVTVPILMYHHVSALAPTTDLNYGLTVTDQDFAAQLSYLHAHGYHTVLLRQVFAALYQHHPLPAHPIVLTFDDGYLDNYTDALPLLRRAHDLAEFNIITAYPGITLGVNSYMTWNQIKQLVADGMEIGSHTVDHQDLGTLPEEHVRFELRDSRNILQLRLGVPVQFLAYPAGEPFRSGSLFAQQLLLRLLPQYGYVGAVLDGPLTTSVQDARQPFELRRIRVSGGEDLAAFAASLQQ